MPQARLAAGRHAGPVAGDSRRYASRRQPPAGIRFRRRADSQPAPLRRSWPATPATALASQPCRRQPLPTPPLSYASRRRQAGTPLMANMSERAFSPASAASQVFANIGCAIAIVLISCHYWYCVWLPYFHWYGCVIGWLVNNGYYVDTALLRVRA